MKDSDNLHEICNSANPPINYLSEDSYVIIELVKAINMFYKHPIVSDLRHYQILYRLRIHLMLDQMLFFFMK